MLFRLLLIYHPPNLFQCHIPILPLNITDFNLPAVSPLQSEPQLEFDRRTTNHGLQKAPKKFEILEQQERKVSDSLITTSTSLHMTTK